MPFLLIKGQFLPERGQPDGDSVRFTPADPGLFDKLEQVAGRKPKTSTDAAGRISTQLRFGSIDALEKDSQNHLAAEATANNKKLLGYDPATDQEPAGYILASGVEKNGRPIVFVFAGDINKPDGSSIFLTPADVKKSVNFKQIVGGLAYPMYYMSLYAELRNVLTTGVAKAQADGVGVWQEDKSQAGFAFQTRNGVRTLPPIFPKMYRRLQKSNATSTADFIDSLSGMTERLLILSEGRFVNFDNVVARVGSSKLKLTHAPEDLVFDEG